MILIVDMNHRKNSLAFSEFVLPIVSVAETVDVCTTKHYTEVVPADTRKYNKIILSGAALKDCAYMEDIHKFAWLKKTGAHVLGICAGMQVIGAVFGSYPRKCSEISMTEIETVKNNPLFSGRFSAYELHNWAADVPLDFCVLAKSKRCVQAIKHRKKEIYGVLFHPEVRNREIIKQFLVHNAAGR